MLQIWSEKAAGMAPCLFSLRNLEGLGKEDGGRRVDGKFVDSFVLDFTRKVRV